MIQTWHITPTQNIEPDLAAPSLDAITRQLPDGYYSTFRTFDGCTRVLGLTAHLRRLYEPVSAPEVSVSHLRRQLLTLLEPYRPAEARVRVMMTKQGQVYISLEPLKRLPPDVYEKGVRVETTEMYRESPRLKSTAFIGASETERKHIAQEGIFEALMVKNGKILEGMTSNFFYITRAGRPPQGERASTAFVAKNAPHFAQGECASTAFVAKSAPHSAQREGILCTAQRDILLGITRKTVIDVALGRGLDVQYQPLQRDQLPAVAEAFITSSSRGIVPVIQIDEATIGQGRPGLITQQLMAAYEAYVLEKAEKI